MENKLAKSESNSKENIRDGDHKEGFSKMGTTDFAEPNQFPQRGPSFTFGKGRIAENGSTNREDDSGKLLGEGKFHIPYRVQLDQMGENAAIPNLVSGIQEMDMQFS
ncbi:hypothetical protein U1Q18_011605 [Sarracenia purpurea var. burkii]